MAEVARPSKGILLTVLKFFVVFPALLFLPAGTLKFWQAWALWSLVGLLMALGGTYFVKHDPALMKRRLRRGPVAEKETSQKIIIALLSVFLVASFLIPGLDHRFGWSHVPPLVVVAGDLLVAAGFLLIFLTFKVNSFAAATIDVEPTQTVATTGPYRIVRHPMYIGVLLVLTFFPLALGSYWALLIAPFTFALIVWRLLDEERFLARNLSGYEEYCRTTRSRLIPYVW